MSRTDPWWLDIRFSRSAKPHLAAESEERAAIYTSALEQFEQLMTAAEASGTAGRPLPLFYALSQAGRAITAAHRAENDWNHHAHGLTVQNDTYADGLGALVKKQGGAASSFQVVRKTVGSKDLRAPVPIGGLMMSLPDLVEVPVPDGVWRRPLPFLWTESDAPFLTPRVIEGVVYIGADNLEPRDVLGSIERTLAAYPTTNGWQHPNRGGLEPPQWVSGEESRGGIVLWWPSPSPQLEALAGYANMIAPAYRYEEERWLWPSTNPDDPSLPVLLSPLMTWWTFLFALSMFARYEPASWGRLLDIEASGWAVAIEHALEAALESVPHLVRDALVGVDSLHRR